MTCVSCLRAQLRHTHDGAAAWLASHLRRDTILQIMGCVALLAIGTTSYTLLYASGMQQYVLLCAALALWGVAQVGQWRCVCVYVCGIAAVGHGVGKAGPCSVQCTLYI